MKKYLKTGFAFVLALVFLSSMSYSQSKETGAIEGVVRDSEEVPLPGVEVTISSPNMIGGAQSKITDVDGKFRFVGLQPGTYSIEASLKGFTSQKRENIRLFVGKTLTADFVLEIASLEEEITVTAVIPLIDVKDSGIITTSIDSKTMTDVIFSRKSYYTFDVMSLAPGTVGTEAYGVKRRAYNVYQIDGVDTSTPSSGSDWMEPDIQIFQEANVQGLGAPAEYDGFTGVVLSLITKSGGNNFDGMAQFVFRDFGWNVENVDVTEPKYSLYEAPPRHRYMDVHFSLGGPIIKDRIWFYGAATYVKTTTELEGQPQDDVLKQPKGFFKLTFQPFKTTRIWVSTEYDGYISDYRGLSPLRPAEAATYEYSPSHSYNLSGIHTFSDRTLMEFKIATSTVDDEGGGYAGGTPGRETSGHYDALTGIYSENNSSFSKSLGYRFQINSSLSHHADEFIKGSHDFKFGVEYEKISDQRERDYNGGFFYVHNVYNWDDHQFHDYAYEYSSYRDVSGTRGSIFIQDAWKITDNLTINPGVRYNIYRGYLKSLDATPFKTSAFVPRIGITWDIFGDHSTALKAHYGKFVDKLKSIYFRDASTGINDYVMYEVLPDGTKAEVYRVNYSNPATIDPDIKIPSVDQFTIGIERELWKDTSLGVSFIWKKWKNFLYRINSGATYEKVEFTFDDEKGIEHTMDAYNKTSPSSADKFYVTNPKAGIYDSIIMDPQRKYIGFIVDFTKRFSNKWMLSGSYAAYKTTSNSTSRNPNAQINSLAGYTNHTFKIYGTVVLPFDIIVNHYFQYLYGLTLLPGDGYRTGGRWARTVRAPVQGSPTVKIEKIGTNKLPDTINLDIKLEKQFTIKDEYRIGILVDVVNIFNRGKETDLVSLITSSNFGKATRFNPGRLYRVAIRFYF